MSATELKTTTMEGLHDFVVSSVLARFVKPGERAVDLGAGSGLLATRMRELGWNVTGADRDATAFKASVPFQQVDLNDPGFSKALGENQFSMVTAVEVIEHVETPIGLLRNARRLLKPGGRIVITTPNVDSIPARVKFLLSEKIRMMDEVSEPTHISPLFWDLFQRQFLPIAGLQIQEHHLVPPNGFIGTRKRYSWMMRGLSGFVRGECKFGDNHVIVLEARQE
ncbi:MAG TPA: methyltransferase domain-containing protein [Terriglobales bacterium]|jgi:2-polyprenyl-3-methyl-5-hydroxy-6-metoxy-1,4-benzoquinol methylase|nr:methyltransferase domain-containing protein [Terriglobales bacterium]